MKNNFEKIIRYILSLKDKTIFIGVDGKSGSGKSTFSIVLKEELKNRGIKSEIIGTDNFYKKLEKSSQKQAGQEGYDYGYYWQRLRDKIIIPLSQGQEVEYELKHWQTGLTFGMHRVKPNQLIILEGVTSTYKKISSLIHLKIWLDCYEEIRLERIKKRGDFPADELREWTVIEDDYVKKQLVAKNYHLIVDTSRTLKDLSIESYTVRQIHLK